MRRCVYSSHYDNPNTDFVAAPGWFGFVHPPRRCQTALRGRALTPSSATTAAASPRRLRNLSVPTDRSIKVANSTRRSSRNDGNDVREESPRESRPACARVLPFAASVQLEVDSVVGPHRWSWGSSFGGERRRKNLGWIEWCCESPDAGGGSNQTATGSGVCRNATERSSLRKKSR